MGGIGDDELRIPSFRVCFDFERRIHHVDRWRIPVPYGLPLRGIAYAAAALAIVLVLQGLPLFGPILAIVHPALRLVVLPVGVAVALLRLRIDGRPIHVAAIAWGRWRSAPARVAAFRAAEPLGPIVLGDAVVAGDERGVRYRPAEIVGPATLTLRYPATAELSGSRLRLRENGKDPLWRGKSIRVERGRRLRLR